MTSAKDGASSPLSQRRLIFDHLALGYSGTPVLVDVCGALEAGQALALVGPNGSGKTTLLKALTGAVDILAGQIHRPEGAIGYVPQTAELDLSFPVTVEHVVMMGLYREIGWARLPKARHRERVATALARVGLAEQAKRRFGDLSGGQRQRVLLARALVAQPALILLDEPFNGLDQPNRDALVSIIEDAKAQGVMIIASTHDLGLADSVCDLALLVAGRQIAFGPIRSVLDASHLRLAYGGSTDAARSRHDMSADMRKDSNEDSSQAAARPVCAEESSQMTASCGTGEESERLSATSAGQDTDTTLHTGHTEATL